MQLLPLQSAEAPPAPVLGGRAILIAVVVVVAILAFLWWLDRQEREREQPRRRMRPNRHAATQDTAELARTLYRRLEDEGRVNDTTLRSLQRLGQGGS
jgi:cytoskeletal protein RodZ